MRWIYLPISLLLLHTAAGAVVKTSQENGPWEKIAWWPAGTPDAGDTVVINTDVTGMPGGNFGRLIVSPGKLLTITGGKPQVEGVLSYGTITIAQGAALASMWDVVNHGVLAGEGRLEMTAAASTIGGGGTFSHLAIAVQGHGRIHLGDSIAVASLTVATGDTLDIGSYSLAIAGRYMAGGGAAAPGVVGSGLVTARGEIFGGIRASVLLADPESGPASKRSVPSVTGALGDAGASVTFRSSRRIDFSTLAGRVTIDPEATVTTDGIGEAGAVRVDGSLTVRGTLGSDEPSYRWEISDSLVNLGRVENFTLVMSGAAPTVATDSGTWDQSMSLEYRGPSGGTLLLRGPVAVSSLLIQGLAPSDSNVTIDAGASPVTVRHRFASDATRNNRLISDSIVRIRSVSAGMVEGSTTFDGFWGSAISGRYGKPGGVVRISAPKNAVGSFAVSGTLEVDKQYLLTLDTAAGVTAGGALLHGPIVMMDGSLLDIDGDLRVERGIEGTGRVRLRGARGTLDVAGAVADGISIEVGDGVAPSSVTISGSATLPHLTVRAGGELDVAEGVHLAITRRYDHEVAYQAGTQPAAAPCRVPMSAASIGGGADGAMAVGSVEAGRGYWARFERPERVMIGGEFLPLPMSLPVSGGWNLIGGASVAAPVELVEAEGARIVSPFFLYDASGRATAASRIEPGRGYWVKVEGEGRLVLRGRR